MHIQTMPTTSLEKLCSALCCRSRSNPSYPPPPVSPPALPPQETATSPRLSSELEKVFDYFDENKDGKISPAELQSYMRNVAGEELSSEDAAAVVESSDSDGDGLLCFEDFVKLVDVDGEDEKHKNLQEAFRMYAAATTEDAPAMCITPKSLRRMLRRLGETKTAEECKQMISRFDINGDGVISFDEFKLMML